MPSADPPRRRFPPPWSVHADDKSWRVEDANGFHLAWFVWDERPKTVTGADRMTRAEAYAMAVHFARLPVLLGKQPPL